jgi:hypothetical protein
MDHASRRLIHLNATAFVNARLEQALAVVAEPPPAATKTERIELAQKVSVDDAVAVVLGSISKALDRERNGGAEWSGSGGSSRDARGAATHARCALGFPKNHSRRPSRLDEAPQLVAHRLPHLFEPGAATPINRPNRARFWIDEGLSGYAFTDLPITFMWDGWRHWRKVARPMRIGFLEISQPAHQVRLNCLQKVGVKGARSSNDNTNWPRNC